MLMVSTERQTVVLGLHCHKVYGAEVSELPEQS